LLAVTLSRQGKSLDAEAQYRLVLEEWKGDPWVLNMIGYEMIERDDRHEDAARMSEEAWPARLPDRSAPSGWAPLRRFCYPLFANS
jgi:hypothetical protein